MEIKVSNRIILLMVVRNYFCIYLCYLEQCLCMVITHLIYCFQRLYLFLKTLRVHYQKVTIIGESLCKLFDHVIINLYDKQLKTSDMKFGFKSNHSTTMCSVIYMEINNQYKMKGSNIYTCMLEASKAFDRVHFGSLFRLLLKCNLSQAPLEMRHPG